MDDLEFVRRCANGDKSSWDEFVVKYSRLIYNYIYSVLRLKNPGNFQQSAVADIFQEIFFLLAKDNFKKLKSFKAKNGCSLASWLRQVTINQTLDQVRKLRPGVSIDAENENGLSFKDMLADKSELASDILISEERATHLKDCIDKLDNDDKYFLELHINKGIRLEDMKDFLRLSRGAVDMRKSRIIGRLKECFKSKGFIIP